MKHIGGWGTSPPYRGLVWQRAPIWSDVSQNIVKNYRVILILQVQDRLIAYKL